MGKSHGVTRSDAFLLTEARPARAQRRLAGYIGAALLIGFVLVMPFRERRLPAEPAFIPIIDTLLFINDLVTAVLLYAQFAVIRSRGLVALAMGYLFAALVIAAHLLSFPNTFSPTGLLGSGPQTTVWLYVFWHLALPVAVIAYTLLKAFPTGRVASERVSWNIRLSIIGVLALVTSLVLLATAFESALPPIMIDALRANGLWEHALGPFLLLLSSVAILLLLRYRSSVLDLWLLVVLWAWFIETLLLSMTSFRYSLVWYSGRVFGLLSSSLVLLILLYESTALYARLALSASVGGRERERQRLSLEVVVGAVAHELKQPLTAIVANAAAGAQFLSRQPPGIAELGPILADISADADRASDIIRSILATLSGTAVSTSLVDVAQLACEALALLRIELQAHSVAVELKASPALPRVQGSKGQLLQVLICLLTNAIESMSENADRPNVIHIRCSTISPSEVSFSVQDSGIGVDPRHAHNIFEPLFTTKSHGTGLGLTICKSIVEAHGGVISASPAYPHGSLFEVVLPGVLDPALGHDPAGPPGRMGVPRDLSPISSDGQQG